MPKPNPCARLLVRAKPGVVGRMPLGSTTIRPAGSGAARAIRPNAIKPVMRTVRFIVENDL